MSDILSGISIIIAIIAQVLGLIYSEIDEHLKKDLPNKEKTQERANNKEQLLKLACLKVVPTFLASSILFYLCLPTSIKIISNSELDFWDFSVANTLFVLIDFFGLIYIIITGNLLVKLIRKIISLL